MRRLDVRYQDSAVDDLQGIYLFLVKTGAAPSVARTYVARLREACRRIGDAPEGGRARPDLAPGLRTSSFERRAVVAYRIEHSFVVIEHVFFGGRDIDGFFASERRRRHETP